jgi:hypothetical protein
VKELLRTAVAGLVGALVATTVAVGQPAVADQLDKKAAKVTSAMIKNGTIKKTDLSAEVAGPLAKADTALQGIASGSVTGAELADGSVGTADVADQSLTDIDLAVGSVASSEVANGSLTLLDIASVRGIANIDFPNLAAGACAVSAPLSIGNDLGGDLILVSNPPDVAGAVQIDARQSNSSSTSFEIVICNVGTGAFDPPFAGYTYAVIEN